MNRSVLVVLLGGREVGQVHRGRGGRLIFVYDDEWRSFGGAFPLSLSMPLAAAKHGHERIDAFLWGLLPDNQQVLEGWARRLHVSARNAFSLMAEVGEDCAGAVQLVRPERLEAILSTGAPEIVWLEEDEVAERLRLLRSDHSAWRRPGDLGQFSLAGAQAKTALLWERGRWGVPLGRTPTTHILKPPMGDLVGSVENEHLCLLLAGAAGLPTARSEVVRFGDEIAIVIERYDRARTGELAKAQPILRIHQEDLCQALGVHPRTKYQNDGGPSPEQIAELLRARSSRPEEDVLTFVDALAFNWLIAGTDAHAKNYSILHGSGGRVRLAPLYDIISALPYYEHDLERLRLAMKLGGTFRLRDIGLPHWRSVAEGLRLESVEVVERVSRMAQGVAAQIFAVSDETAGQGLAHPIIDRLAEALARRSEWCVEQLRER